MRPRSYLIILLLLVFALQSCTKKAPAKDAVSASKKTDQASLQGMQQSATPSATASTSTSDSKPTAAAAAAPAVEAVKPDPIMEDCDTTFQFSEGEPIYLPENKVIITRVMSPCRNKEGVPGHKKNAGWMAMGFPCTGGEGRIDWKGTNYNRPKMVSFLLETSCPMGPTDTNRIRSEALKVAGIPLSAPMIAFNPFVIQYWEVPGYEDADTSFTVDLRSGKGLDDAWIKFIKPLPLKIFLVGRENAWVPGNYMYAVEGEIQWASKNRFNLKVTTARKLSGNERTSVQERCQGLRPERECGRVF